MKNVSKSFLSVFLCVVFYSVGALSVTETTKPADDVEKSVADMQLATLHPCYGVSGAPYRKYFAFSLSNGILYKYKSENLTSPKSEPSGFPTVKEFLIDKNILTKDGEKVVCLNNEVFAEKLVALDSAIVDNIKKRPPVFNGNANTDNNNSGIQIGEPTKWASPVLHQKIEHYYGEGLESILAFSSQTTEESAMQKQKLFEIVSRAHIQSPDRPDKIVEQCPEELAGEEECTAPQSFTYRAARQIMFGYLDLQVERIISTTPEDDGEYCYPEYFVYDVYCEKKYFNEDLPEGQGVGVYQIPLHEIINTEHTWPQSRFNVSFSKDVQKTDLHHLYPTDNKHNGRRGNFEFAEIETDSKHFKLTCENNRIGFPGEIEGVTVPANKVYYEVPDAHKGNVARSIFYFSVRYQISVSEVEEHFLRQWNKLDPVDEREKARNNNIYDVQGNRNPFVDFPQLVDQIADF